ncbi:MAG: FGGY-family carbohydrate kinase [Candidatus Omnitrophica bacterium]|nr:FGGY-family carbohydrate kinase [Candidatus Omnitrophota bacterium]
MQKETFSLGIEFSTQSVKIALIDIRAEKIVHTTKFDYDSVFPGYHTAGGVLDSCGAEIRHTSPLMLIEAVDHVFEKLKNDGIRLSSVAAIKIDAMQHCSVYTNSRLSGAIRKLNPAKTLVSQLAPSISRKTSPIWEDRSPVKEAQALTEIKKKSGNDIAAVTGNRAELRFPASQIMKWARESPAEYLNTKHIFVLSAFITSILSGKIAPVDTGDGWGTNLNNLDIKKPGWNSQVLKTIDAYLKITHYDAVIGKVSNYFVKKYGVNPRAIILAGTGDNPATLLGCGGEIVVSLGSSYTVNGVMAKVVPSMTGEYNVFGYTKGSAMALSCITNGGKLHDYFREKYFAGKDKNWDAYIKAAGDRVLNEKENLMLPFLMDESVPLRKKGIVRQGFDENDASANIRALHVSQALSLKIHSSHLSGMKKICIVGGGSKNIFLRQCISDIFNATGYTIENADFAAPIGCAISAARMILGVSYSQACDKFVQQDKGSLTKPLVKNRAVADKLIKRYSAFEKS